jgi:hypothetical protein
MERMAASLSKNWSMADRRMVTLLALNRILFLYFVQAKHWLDGQPDFLSRLLDDSLSCGADFHRTALEPLFFGTLNRAPQDREQCCKFGEIPYLNGGLFEPHTVERRLGSVHFSNELWRDAFDGVFERFRFCINEYDEVDAIAPDMLGRAFERLMDHAERHETGTYYTPESIVRQVVEAAIETALTAHVSSDVAQSLVRRRALTAKDARACHTVLKRLRILDPAVGSGAFLLGALQSLTEMRSKLAQPRQTGSGGQLRREILQENLMGVDLNPIAVRLAELRLWLAVIADDATDDIGKIMPLPNLDGVVRQGDTLLDPLSAAQMLSPASLNLGGRSALSVSTARRALFDARGEALSTNMRNLRAAETLMAYSVLDHAMENTVQATNDLASVALSNDLFGKRTGLSAAQRQRHRALKRVRQGLLLARKKITEGELPFFAFEVHAPDIMADGGFDMVVGNPPWVRAERLPLNRRRALRKRFSWWRGDHVRGFAHLPDLSVAFLQRCLELTAPDGAVGLLLPSKITSAAYGETARRALVKETSIAYLNRIAEKDAARFKATTYPLAVVVQKKRPTRDHEVKIAFTEDRAVLQRLLDVPGSWIILPSKARNAIDEFLSAGDSLGSISPPMLGVKTGANDVFVGELIDSRGDSAVVKFGNHKTMVEQALLRPALRGRDIRPFMSTSVRVILWTHDGSGRPLRSLPRKASRYLGQKNERLRSRQDYQSGPTWTVFRVAGAISTNRVVWSDIARYPRAVALDEVNASTAVPLNTCYVAAAPDREVALAIAATLNSSWAHALCLVSADEARGGYRRINARLAAQIPIPAGSASREALADLSRRAHQREDVNQDQVDEAVADALDLSGATRKVLRSLAPHRG